MNSSDNPGVKRSISKSAQETKDIAQKLAQSLREPTVLALYGELGSGKTTFLQALAEKLGVNQRVLSPTFVLLRSYPLQNQAFSVFHHLDLYRTTTKADALTSGIEEILAQKGALVAIEWPETIEDILPNYTRKIRFKKLGEEEREIEIS